MQNSKYILTKLYSSIDGAIFLPKNYLIDKILIKIKLLFKKLNYSVELDELMKLNFDQLVNTICMISPFSNEEKQKLIEVIKIEDKVKSLEEIINFNLAANQQNKTIQ